MRKQMNRRTAARQAFTLLEVLLVLVILGVLAAMVVPNILGTQERANANATRASIKGLDETLKTYAVEHSARYPETIEVLLNPTDAQGNAQKPYLDEFPTDAWGQPFNYELTTDASRANMTVPRIWSNGPNGTNEDGSGDDISNFNEASS